MKDGIYIAYFTGNRGSGSSVLALSGGKIAGADSGGAHVSGSYLVSDPSVAFSVTYEFKHATELATSGHIVPAGFSFQLRFEAASSEVLGTEIRVETPTGPVNARFEYVSDLP